MKKFSLIVLFIVLCCTSVFADDIVELDSYGHINLVDRVKNIKEKFFPNTVQSGPSDSELLNQIIESSVSKFVSVSSDGWADVVSDVYNLIGVSGTVIDSATTVTQEAIDKINGWFDLSEDGFIRSNPSWRTDMSHIYNLKGFYTVEGGAPSGFFPIASYNGLNYNNVLNLYFTIHETRPIPTDMFNRIYVTSYWSGGNLWSLFCMRDGVMYNRFVAHWGGTATNILPNDVVSYMGGSYNPLKTIDAAPKSTAYSDLQSALDAFFGEWPSGGTFYNHSMYMNTDDSYNPDIFIRSLPATNWQNVSNNRYNFVGSDPTADSINNTFNSFNPVYNNVNYNYNFDDVYNNRDYPVYEFDSDNDYFVPDIELSTDFDKSNLFYDIGNFSTDSEGGSFYVTLFGIIATFLILGVIL